MADKEREEQQAYEARLRRRLEILKKQFEGGKVSIAEGLEVEKSLLAVRYGPDGEIDLSTVDGVVRSMALAFEHLHDREEAKSTVPLQEVQQTYFRYIRNNFGHYYDEMLRRGLTPEDVAISLSENAESRENLIKYGQDFLNSITEFWGSAGDAVHAHIEDMHGTLKGVFGGDFFPSPQENIASKCGIYTDTIILPDPYLRSLLIYPRWDDHEKAYYLVKHAMSLLQYESLACADVTPPIVVVVPDYTALENTERQFMLQLGQDDAVFHAGEIFGRKFVSFEEVMDFAKSLDTVDKVIAEVKNPHRVLFDTEWEGGVRDTISKARTHEYSKLVGTDHPGVLVATTALGRMATSNELLVKAHRLGGVPIIEAPTSWKYFSWKLEYDSLRAASGSPSKDLHIVRGLQALNGAEFSWLGKVPPEGLIELRKEGALPEIRAILSNGIEKIATANPDNFFRTADQVFENMRAALEAHQNDITKLRNKKLRFAGMDIGSWFVIGSLEMAAVTTGMPFFGVATILANQLTDVPKLKDIPASIRELAAESQKLKKSPVGLLFKYRKSTE